MDKFTYLKISQLDSKLKKFCDFEIPENGWINKIRNTLDITFAHIAKKLNTSPQVVKKFEQNEIDGSITLNSLKKVADAMECRLVYAFIPKEKSFESLVDKKAEKISDYISSGISNSMNLEDQKLNKSALAKQKKHLKNDLLKNNLKNLWKYEI